jgi:hemolysin-activating ACP:hemolysin acyltransferase
MSGKDKLISLEQWDKADTKQRKRYLKEGCRLSSEDWATLMRRTIKDIDAERGVRNG